MELCGLVTGRACYRKQSWTQSQRFWKRHMAAGDVCALCTYCMLQLGRLCWGAHKTLSASLRKKTIFETHPHNTHCLSHRLAHTSGQIFDYRSLIQILLAPRRAGVSCLCGGWEAGQLPTLKAAAGSLLVQLGSSFWLAFCGSGFSYMPM